MTHSKNTLLKGFVCFGLAVLITSPAFAGDHAPANRTNKVGCCLKAAAQKTRAKAGNAICNLKCRTKAAVCATQQKSSLRAQQARTARANRKANRQCCVVPQCQCVQACDCVQVAMNPVQPVILDSTIAPLAPVIAPTVAPATPVLAPLDPIEPIQDVPAVDEATEMAPPAVQETAPVETEAKTEIAPEPQPESTPATPEAEEPGQPNLSGKSIVEPASTVNEYPEIDSPQTETTEASLTATSILDNQ